MPQFTPEQVELIKQKLASSFGYSPKVESNIQEYEIGQPIPEDNNPSLPPDVSKQLEMERILQKQALMRAQPEKTDTQPEVYSAIEPRFNKLRQFIKR